MFVMVSENIGTICLKNFHTEYGKCVATVLLFSETSHKECSNVLCGKPVILLELFLELRIVVIQDGEDGKRSVRKRCARKIVNCYRMFMELWEALEGGRALDEVKESTPQTPSSASPRGSIPVRGQRSLTEVTPKAKWQKKSTCGNEVQGAHRRPSMKRALFSDQYSELDNEITSPEQA